MSEFLFSSKDGSSLDDGNYTIYVTHKDEENTDSAAISYSSAISPDDSWKSSEAYYNSNGSSASPSITITETTIWLYHAQTGGGSVTLTSLRGAGGNYTMSESGKAYTVSAGTYTHAISGTIVNDGWIGSGIRYK